MKSNYARGVELSEQVKWSGEDIFEVAYSAFEDANFHSFNEVFHAAWKEYMEEYKEQMKEFNNG
jgi:hypothetical protein